MVLLNVAAVSRFLLLLTAVFSSGENKATAQDYNTCEFLATFKDGFSAVATFDAGKDCEYINRTSLKNDNTMAQYDVTAVQTEGKKLQIYSLLFKSETCTSEIDLTKIKKDGEEQVKYTLVYFKKGVCAIVQEDPTPNECKLYMYTEGTQDDIDECQEKFPPSCGEYRYTYQRPEGCIV